jgi:hypothetical protein
MSRLTAFAYRQRQGDCMCKMYQSMWQAPLLWIIPLLKDCEMARRGLSVHIIDCGVDFRFAVFMSRKWWNLAVQCCATMKIHLVVMIRTFFPNYEGSVQWRILTTMRYRIMKRRAVARAPLQIGPPLSASKLSTSLFRCQFRSSCENPFERYRRLLKIKARDLICSWYFS